MISTKEKALPIVDIDETIDELPAELKNDQPEEEEEYGYRCYPYLDVF